MALMTLTNSSGLTITDAKSAPIQVREDHPNFEKIFEAIGNPSTTMEDIEKLVNFQTELNFKDGAVEIKVIGSDVSIIFDGKPRGKLPSGLKKRIIETVKVGTSLAEFNLKLISKFLVRLYNNPSFMVVDQLYRFIEANNLPITQDGHFLVYKKVDYDYFDLHSHTFENKIGTEISMNRNEVRDDPKVTCAEGLHVCSKEYLDNYGSNNSEVNRIVICDVDPADVVSVPVDYNNSKMRVCFYKVVDELTDFDVSLSSYVIGRHANGWISETLGKIKNFYSTFWRLDISKKFEFEKISGVSPFINDAILAKFVSEAEAVFGRRLDIEDAEDFITHPLELLTYLSRFDSESLTTDSE